MILEDGGANVSLLLVFANVLLLVITVVLVIGDVDVNIDGRWFFGDGGWVFGLSTRVQIPRILFFFCSCFFALLLCLSNFCS